MKPQPKLLPYDDFLRSKVKMAGKQGNDIDAGKINPNLKPHQADIVRWMVEGGRRACFAAFGLGKSVIQLETVRLTIAKTGGRGLIVMPLNVRQEFIHDAVNILGWTTPPKFIRRLSECDDEHTIYLTNYETIREGKIDAAEFEVASLDEAAILRGFGGVKTFREIMRMFTGDGGPTQKHRLDGKSVKYRFVATATPSPNEYIELLAYAEFLGIMDVSQAKTRFFKRDSTKADKLTLHPHKEPEFWYWVSSWAIFVQKPSDLGHSDAGYSLPPMKVNWHEVASDHLTAGYEKQGQRKMFRDAAASLSDAASEKRSSMGIRIEKTLQIIFQSRRLQSTIQHDSQSKVLCSSPMQLSSGTHGGQSEQINRGSALSFEQFVIWVSLNDEQDEIQKALNKADISHSSIRGSDDLEYREKMMDEWKAGNKIAMVSKTVMYGSGINMQQCHRMIFLGIGFKFSEFIQGIHRIHRFLQKDECIIDIIYTEAERGIRKALERKWQQHIKITTKMSKIIKEFGLSQIKMAGELTRKMGCERIEVSGPSYRMVNWDSVKECETMQENSVGLILTSIPFSTQYEYSPNYADFGHSEGNVEFFKQMDYLIPNLLRVLKPGRIAAIHVKDRIVPGGMTGLGYQTVYPFHFYTMQAMCKHGFGYMGMKTIVTDVVRENNQTYRLGWTEQCKDGSKMGVGMPEYLLLFRKSQTSSEKSYADEPVIKTKDEYSRSRWQIDAHGFARSSGNRLLDPDELKTLSHADIFQLFKKYSLEKVYNFEHHVKIGESLDREQMLPVTFMLLQPQSWSPEVWTDITRMLTLNGAQSAKGKEMHLCPMQFDLADRVIAQMSNKGDIVFDPFSGLGTVPQRAILLGRQGWGCELSHNYFLDACGYAKAASIEFNTPELFDITGDNQVSAVDTSNAEMPTKPAKSKKPMTKKDL